MKKRNLSLCFVLILCFAVSLSTTMGQAIISPSITIESSGAIKYTPSSTPTPTLTPTPIPSPTPTPQATPTPTPQPTPTLTPNPSNLAPINDGQWYSDSTWSICPADNIYYDTSTTYQGNPSWRIQPGASLAVDHNWGALAVKPGDHVVITVWVKTTGTPDSVLGRSGATVGIDFYGNYGGAWARIDGVNAPQQIADEGNYIADNWAGSAAFMVPWGSDWTLRTYDFIVPSQMWGDGVMSSNQVPRGTYCTPAWICPWLQISANYGSTSGTYTTWFSDFQLYINP